MPASQIWRRTVWRNPNVCSREERVDRSMLLRPAMQPADFSREAGLIDADLRRSE